MFVIIFQSDTFDLTNCNLNRVFQFSFSLCLISFPYTCNRMRLVFNDDINLRFDKSRFTKLRINVHNDQNELEIDLENPFLICGDCTFCTFAILAKSITMIWHFYQINDLENNFQQVNKVECYVTFKSIFTSIFFIEKNYVQVVSHFLLIQKKLFVFND